MLKLIPKYATHMYHMIIISVLNCNTRTESVNGLFTNIYYYTKYTMMHNYFMMDTAYIISAVSDPG